MDKILESFLENFKTDFEFTDIDNSKLFEHFINYCIISKIEQDRSIIEQINVGGENNPGIDGLAIIVNDHIVSSKEDVDYFYDTLGRLDVEFIFVQTKLSKKFEMSEINNFIFSVKNFFSEANLKFGDDVLNLKEIKDYIFDNSIKMENSPILKLFYATTGNWKNDQNILSLIEASKKELMHTGLFKSIYFNPIDAEKIKSMYREIKHKITKEINFEKHTILPFIKNVTEAYIGYLPVKEYLNLLANSDGEIMKNIFYDNVRDFQGFNNVNKDIKESINQNELHDKFVLLNNGITIVAKNINKVGSSFKISDYQIVNGCQTSHVIYYLRDKISDTLNIPIKLIVTDENEVTNKIIQGTNQQTEVKNEAFEILLPFHKKLEEFYLSFEKDVNKRLYYERRSKQYDSSKINRNYIITLSTQITSFISMFLNEPHSTRRYFGELLRAYRSRLFKEEHSPFPYYTSGFAFYMAESFYRSGVLQSKYKRFKPHLLMLFRIKNAGEKIPPLNSKKIDDYCNNILENLWNRDKAKKTFTELENLIVSKLNSTKLLKRQAHVLRAFTEELIPSIKDDKTIGELVYFNNIKGYGFIKTNDLSEDIFVHISDLPVSIKDNPSKGIQLQFYIQDTFKGKQAINITLL